MGRAHSHVADVMLEKLLLFPQLDVLCKQLGCSAGLQAHVVTAMLMSGIEWAVAAGQGLMLTSVIMAAPDSQTITPQQQLVQAAGSSQATLALATHHSPRTMQGSRQSSPVAFRQGATSLDVRIAQRLG